MIKQYTSYVCIVRLHDYNMFLTKNHDGSKYVSFCGIVKVERNITLSMFYKQPL